MYYFKKETRSTEDLYIDDDFCQGISQSLAANMELLPPPDFFDSLDFNIFSAEFFHTHEHEFDATLTEGEHLKRIENVERHDDNNNDGDKKEEGEMETLGTSDVPICDDNQVENIQKKDEPKVEN